MLTKIIMVALLAVGCHLTIKIDSIATTTTAQLSGLEAQLGDLKTFANTTTAQLGDLKTFATTTTAQLSGLEARATSAEAFAITTTAQLSGLEARATSAEALAITTTAQLADLSRDVRAVRSDVTALHDAALTPMAAERVDLCATRSTFHVFVPTSPGKKPEICSAFAYKPRNAPPQIVSAAHCFSHLASNSTVSLQHLSSSLTMACSVVFATAEPQDAAVLSCGNVNLVEMALARATTRARLGQNVAVVGFTNDAYSSATSHHLHGSKIALNVDFSQLIPVAGPMRDALGRACTSGTDERSWNLLPQGYVNRRVTGGLSGGPVVDLNCFVIGIAHGRSCGGGVFSSLDPIDSRFAEA